MMMVAPSASRGLCPLLALAAHRLNFLLCSCVALACALCHPQVLAQILAKGLPSISSPRRLPNRPGARSHGHAIRADRCEHCNEGFERLLGMGAGAFGCRDHGYCGFCDIAWRQMRLVCLLRTVARRPFFGTATAAFVHTHPGANIAGFVIGDIAAARVSVQVTLLRVVLQGKPYGKFTEFVPLCWALIDDRTDVIDYILEFVFPWRRSLEG